MTLFKQGSFISHAGKPLPYKIDCDALTQEDWATIAEIIATRLHFGSVVGVPRGGLALAAALEPYCTTGPRLIVDDVLTTGTSMREMRKPGDMGAVLFARGQCPAWIYPVFVLQATFR